MTFFTGCTVYLTPAGTDVAALFANNAIVTDDPDTDTLVVETRSTVTNGLWDEVLRLEQAQAVTRTGAIMVWRGDLHGEQVRVLAQTHAQGSAQAKCVPCAKHR